MKRRRQKSGMMSLLGIILALFIIKNLLPMVAWLASSLLAVAAIAFVVLCVAVIASSLKDKNRGTTAPAGVDTKTSGASASAPPSRALTPDERQTLANANAGLVQIRTMTTRVKDPEIRRLFAQVGDIVSEILKSLRSDPNDIQPAHRVLSYYIPSLHEILKKYLKLEMSGTDMGDTPEKLKSHLVEIKDALDRQYQTLYNNDKLDLSVEMKAMSIALKRDGLIEDDISAQSFEETLKKTAEEFQQVAMEN